MAATILPDYPAPPGNKPVSIFTVTGPTSYTAITAATPPTGGQSIAATLAGLTQFEWVSDGCSDNGQYGVKAIFASNPVRELSSIQLMWITLATGAEVSGATNLSGRTVRLMAVGR